MRTLRVIAIILTLFLVEFLLLLRLELSGYSSANLPEWVNSNQSVTVCQNICTSSEPLILLFRELENTHVYVDRYWNFKFDGPDCASKLHLPSCPHKCCFTIDTDRYQDTADMVILNTFWLTKKELKYNRTRVLERQKTAGQIWVGFTRESPHTQGRRGMRSDDVVHWTATYRKDADIYWPYGTYKKRNFSLEATRMTNKHKSKKKLAAWLVSRCWSNSKRELLVETLRRYIPVDIYGKCGKRQCPQGIDCRAHIAANYKFYLAFENSLCADYVTEKMFFMLNQSEPIVPVTYSWINDTTVAPPNSYIDANNFKSIKDLADYLLYLDRNDNEYNAYLQWKNDYEIVIDAQDTKLCRACEMLLKHKARLANGGESLKRQTSMFKWHNSFANGANFSYIKVGGDFIKSETVCFSPDKNNGSINWLFGEKLRSI